MTPQGWIPSAGRFDNLHDSFDVSSAEAPDI